MGGCEVKDERAWYGWILAAFLFGLFAGLLLTAGAIDDNGCLKSRHYGAHGP